MYSKEEVITLTSDLIAFPSTKDNQTARKEVIDYIKHFFKNESIYLKEFEHQGVYSLVITLKREKRPKLLLNGHVDVVTAPETDFVAKVKGDRLYGRGAGDMKGAVAVMMMIVRDLSRLERKPSVGLLITTDEEVGGKNGAGYLVNTKGYTPEYLIVPDGGTDLNKIILNQKGILHLKVTARGMLAHGARPYQGENAIEKLMAYYRRIQKIVPPLTKPQWKNSINLGKIEGGKNANSVPDHAEMLLDIRYVNRDDRDRILQEVQEAVDDGSVEIVAEGEPFIQSKTHPFVKTYAQVASEETGNPIVFGRVEGASDARFFSAHGVPTIITKINCDNIHADREWLDLSQTQTFYTIITRLVDEWDG